MTKGMETQCWIAVVVIFITMNATNQVVARPEDCGQRLRNCTTMIRPFLHDLKYMFPTTIDDVDMMCRIWGSFVDCIRYYTKDCATADQRRRFNNAVGDSMDTVRAVCSSEKYQKEYLQSATCFRKVSVEKCGSHYNDLVEEVTNTVANNDNICCSYTKFKSCVSEPLLRLCGSRARTIMDHSMAFLIHRCSSKSFSLSFECPKSGRGRLDPEGGMNEMNTSESTVGLTNSTSNGSPTGQGDDRTSGTFGTSGGASSSSDTFGTSKSSTGSENGENGAESSRRTQSSFGTTHNFPSGSSPKDTFEIDFENSIGSSMGSSFGNGDDSDDYENSRRSSKRPPPFFGSRLQRNYENSASDLSQSTSMKVFFMVLISAILVR